MTERKVLGRGIASLISKLPPQGLEPEPASAHTRNLEAPAGSILELEPDSIRINPRQPRRHFSESALEELTGSITRHGVLQPLLVRRTDLGYELIAGERRLRAARRAGLKHVPVLVRSGTDRDQLELALIENLQREDLNPIEEARGYDLLSREFALTQEEIAQRVGKERSTVTNMLRLLKLAPAVQEMISGGTLSMGHARAILPVEDFRRQEELAHRIEKEGLSVRQVEGEVRQMLRPHKGKRSMDANDRDANLRHLAEELQRTLGTRVEVVARGKGGEIRIQYYNPDDLKRLTDRLRA